MVERVWVDSHGVEVSSRWWTHDDPRGVVLISHGASEHSGRYERFARSLNAAGFSAIAIDHRGHGRTATATGVGRLGAGGGRALLDDLDELRASAATKDDIPTFVFGHSLGSLIALTYLVDHSDGLAGAVLCGFPVDIDGAASFGPMLQGFADQRDEPFTGLLAGNNAAFEPARTPYDWLSRDPAEVDRYLADPLCGDDHPLTYGYLIDLFEVVAPVRDRLASISCPVLVIAGDQDPAGGMGAHPTELAAVLTAAGVPTDLTLYASARHELLNETNRDEVTADVIDWLVRH